jgi:hypothetical protein
MCGLWDMQDGGIGIQDIRMDVEGMDVEICNRNKKQYRDSSGFRKLLKQGKTKK